MKIKPPTAKQLNVFVFGLSLILLFFAWKAYRIQNIKIALLLITVGIILLIVYFTNKKLVVKFYLVWMKIASFIGMVVTGILMFAIFYFVFTPVGLFLRLIKKDVLHLNKNPKLKSYWIDRPHREFNKSDYEKQF
jgi:hypothetical protein